MDEIPFTLHSQFYEVLSSEDASIAMAMCWAQSFSQIFSSKDRVSELQGFPVQQKTSDMPHWPQVCSLSCFSLSLSEDIHLPLGWSPDPGSRARCSYHQSHRAIHHYPVGPIDNGSVNIFLVTKPDDGEWGTSLAPPIQLPCEGTYSSNPSTVRIPSQYIPLGIRIRMSAPKSVHSTPYER